MTATAKSDEIRTAVSTVAQIINTITPAAPSAVTRECAARLAGACPFDATLVEDDDDWLDTAIALSDRWRVIALDQRGHGGSARPGRYSFELMRDDLAAFIDRLGLVHPVLIGHSMGGTVAYLYIQARPDSVGKLVIVDTPPPFPPPSPWPEPDPVPDDVPFDGRVLVPIIRQLNAPDPAWWAELAKVRIPLLLIGGGSSSPIPQDKLAEVVARD